MTNLYLLALLPPEDLSRQIHEIRLECAEKFGVQKSLKIPVHISLYRPFRVEEAFEKHLIRLLTSAASGLKAFEQTLENFEAFDMHAVVIHAKKNQGITALHSAIASVFKKNEIDKLPPGNKNFPFRPHVSIAYRDILPEIFPQIWEEYKDRKFKRHFRVNHFSLLKHDETQWNLFKDFKLSDTVQQTELFD